MTKRIEKINSLLKNEVGKILNEEIVFPPNVLVTIIDIDTSTDLRHATIKIDVLPLEKINQVLKILNKNIYHLQQLLNKKLVLRFVPKIRFVADKTQKRAERIEEILKEIKKEGE